MFLTINSEKKAIAAEITIVERVRAKLANHIRHSKEFAQFKVVLKLIEKHLDELSMVEKYDDKHSINIAPYLEANSRITNHIVMKVHQVKQLMTD